MASRDLNENVARWDGRHGFFEIWFFVVFDVESHHAYWFRYSTFSPKDGGPARGTVWAATFDERSGLVTGGKSMYRTDAYEVDKSIGSVTIGTSSLDMSSFRGSVDDDGHCVEWDLRYGDAGGSRSDTPWFMDHRLPLPTRVANAHNQVEFSGTVTISGETRRIRRAHGVHKHIWGTRRVDELFWLYSQYFDDDPRAMVEATSVRPRTHLALGVQAPRVVPITVATSRGRESFSGAFQTMLNTADHRNDLSVNFVAQSATRRVDIAATCRREDLVGYVYRDPSGSDRFVAQSDIGDCTVSRRYRSAPWTRFGRTTTLHAHRTAAVEFHLRSPIPGVRYIDWDEGTWPFAASP